MAAFSEERHDINGIETAVLTAGEGAPVVYLHGGGTMTGFDALLPVADNARLIVPIHPGFGQSADDPSIDSLHDYHLHYLDLFDKLGLDEVSLAGHSLGGALAANFAILSPRRGQLGDGAQGGDVGLRRGNAGLGSGVQRQDDMRQTRHGRIRIIDQGHDPRPGVACGLDRGQQIRAAAGLGHRQD